MQTSYSQYLENWLNISTVSEYDALPLVVKEAMESGDNEFLFECLSCLVELIDNLEDDGVYIPRSVKRARQDGIGVMDEFLP